MRVFKTCLALALAALGSVNCMAGELLLKSGDKLAAAKENLPVNEYLDREMSKVVDALTAK
jgi:hypothetical protein